ALLLTLAIVLGATQASFAAPPVINGISPASANVAGSVNVDITGEGLEDASAVLFGGIPATSFFADNSTRVIAIAPAHAAGSVDVSVVTSEGTATLPGGFNYYSQPFVSSVVVDNVTPGTYAIGREIMIKVTFDQNLHLTGAPYLNVQMGAVQRRFTLKAQIWDGAVDRKEFEVIGHRWIDLYFNAPSYYRINGKPVIMIYELTNLVQGLGGIEQARDALQWLRKTAVEAGYPGLEIQYAMRRENAEDATIRESDRQVTQHELIDRLGIDSLTHYQYAHFADISQKYETVTREARNAWNSIASTYKQTYYPHVSIDWDPSPRGETFVGTAIKDSTPEGFATGLESAKRYLSEHPRQRRLVTVNSWNEWTETSYLQPDDRFGYGYLKAVKRVMCVPRQTCAKAR
ncbi:MAG: hypothetical protein EOO77_11870, partial [Oxalobacteraceae bacterium]